jgi:hypothetical protein
MSGGMRKIRMAWMMIKRESLWSDRQSTVIDSKDLIEDT